MPELLILGCSNRKTEFPGETPALHRYDGPFYQDFRTRLRTHLWSDKLHVAVLSAEYGMIGALTEIPYYDRPMSQERAVELAPQLATQIVNWTRYYDKIHLCLGKGYLAALSLPGMEQSDKIVHFKGQIGEKRQQLGDCLRSLHTEKRKPVITRNQERMSYFLPDWDDLVDQNFDFETDSFSGKKSERTDVHCAHLLYPDRISDGILVSLAQKRESKGPLKYVGGLDSRTMCPINLRRHYGLEGDQSLFGDCGAFSYVNEDVPPLSVENAVSLYELYDFDFGASVDHIPVTHTKVNGQKVCLSQRQRQDRVDITVENADAFLNATKKQKAKFVPVGTVQGLSPKQYVKNVNAYAEMGYSRIALGGLVPLPDKLVLDVVQATMASLRQRKRRVDIHLFGVFRPKLQESFRELGVASFDSATYFRKAWLRSGQNYLSVSGKWYSAIRVPMTSDGRTRNTMLNSGHDLEELRTLETASLTALQNYGKHKISLEAVLDAVIAYDTRLNRSSEDANFVASQYEQTLKDRPWEQCPCAVCKSMGIHVVIFRGSNRNKRRGTHNTWRLYQATRN